MAGNYVTNQQLKDALDEMRTAIDKRFDKITGWVRWGGSSGFVLLGIVVAAVLNLHTAHGASSCVTAYQPVRSHSHVYSKATESCGGRARMLVLIQARHDGDMRPVPLATGTTSDGSVKVGALRCPYRGRWHIWTLATRGISTDTSTVLSYRCR